MAGHDVQSGVTVPPMGESPATATRVAFVGLGRMGVPMAHALLRGGFPVAVANRPPRPASGLAEAGATVATSPAQAARDADVVITMVADGTAARAVLTGPDGVAAGARPGTGGVAVSTIGPPAARALAAELADVDLAMLDAPVSGSVAAAQSGTLVVVAGGDPEAFARARPVLAAMSKTQLWLGPSGAGAAMKLALNGMIAATTLMLSEALVVAERAGIAREDAYDAIAASAVGAPFVEYKRAAFLDPEREPTAFSLQLMQKDVALALAQGREAGVPLAAVAAADQALTLARGLAGDDADIAQVAAVLRDLRPEGVPA